MPPYSVLPSVIIDGIVFVIDSGMANVAGYDQVRQITRSSAKQRRGGAGRTQSGVCYHLYSEEDYTVMEDTQISEIKCSNLAITVLKLTELFGKEGGSVHNFEFVERPSEEALDKAISGLLDHAAIVSTHSSGNRINYLLTECGRHILKLKQPPEICRMIFYGIEHGVQSAVLAIASILSAGSYIFYRSGSDDKKAEADRHKATFRVPGHNGTFFGDWLAMLEVYRGWLLSGKNKLWCEQHFVVGKTLLKASREYDRILSILRTEGLDREDIEGISSEKEVNILLHSVCTGFFKNVCLTVGAGTRAGFKVGRLQDRTVVLHPSSVLGLMNSTPTCIIYEELVKTSRYFVKGVTVVDVDMIIKVSPTFCERIRLKQLSEKQFVSSDFTDIGPVLKKLIVGRKGSTMQELERSLTATIEIDGTTVKLWTTRESAESAASRFTQFLCESREVIRNQTEEISIPSMRVRAVVTSGCGISQLLFRNQYRKALLRGLPPDFPWTSSAPLIASHARISVEAILEVSCLAISPDGSSSWGYVLCSDHNTCSVLVSEFDQSFPSSPAFKGRKITSQTSSERNDEPFMSDTTVKGNWNCYLANGDLAIHFAEEGYALLAYELLELFPLTIGGIVLSTISMKGKTVKLKCFPPAEDEELISKTLSYRTDIKGILSVQVIRDVSAVNADVATDRAICSEMAAEVAAELGTCAGAENNDCKLCFTDPEDYTLQLCGHRCCRSCLRRMLTMFSKPDISSSFPFKCPISPDCKEVIALADITAVCDRATFEQICIQSATKFVNDEAGYMFCPGANCNGVLMDNEVDQGRKVCDACLAEFCTHCSGRDGVMRGVPWHENLTCEQFQRAQNDNGEELLKEFMTQSGGRSCSRCKNFVIRNGGCDHMTCLCGNNFCYLCGKQSTSGSCRNPCS